MNYGRRSGQACHCILKPLERRSFPFTLPCVAHLSREDMAIVGPLILNCEETAEDIFVTPQIHSRRPSPSSANKISPTPHLCKIFPKPIPKQPMISNFREAHLENKSYLFTNLSSIMRLILPLMFLNVPCPSTSTPLAPPIKI